MSKPAYSLLVKKHILALACVPLCASAWCLTVFTCTAARARTDALCPSIFLSRLLTNACTHRDMVQTHTHTLTHRETHTQTHTDTHIDTQTHMRTQTHTQINRYQWTRCVPRLGCRKEPAKEWSHIAGVAHIPQYTCFRYRNGQRAAHCRKQRPRNGKAASSTRRWC
jgi:hypothetical protein